jgi:peptidoglycan/xylan/chitin deacetylase (PgdA/CDA1 family)
MGADTHVTIAGRVETPDLAAFGQEDEHWLTEGYREEGGSSPLHVYDAVKPLIPRRAQLAMRRRYARVQARRAFPAWPVEPLLVRRRLERRRAAVERAGGAPVPYLAPWPDGHRFAFVLTHDVEGPAGVRNVDRLLEIEQRHGFVSSWNFVAEWYRIPEGLFDRLRAASCEIGLHAVHHDGKLFRSRKRFESELPAIHRYRDEWGVEGFRSPATRRRAAWMPELGFAYDTSFPDTDPFEPQPGGCCSILPYFLGELVELPITLAQDHTLFEILRQETIGLWVRKARWLIEHGGLINLIVHPDYMDEERLAHYDRFLWFLRLQEGGWHALPRDVAAWWRLRAGLRLDEEEGEPVVVGPGAERATVELAGAEAWSG